MSVIPTYTIKESSLRTGMTSKIIIAQNYVLKRLMKKQINFNMYEGIDLKATKFVSIYVKPSNMEFNFSRKIKQELRNKISPRVLWTGNHRIQKVVYNIEIHQKYGPSLKSMFSYIRDPISDRDFLLLLYQFIRLIQKYGSAGYVLREFDMEQIVFDTSPQKNQLFLLNAFALKKRGEIAPALKTRFCSRGAHLGLPANIKNDLQSVCYLLMNIHTQGTFLRNVSQQNYLQAKTHLNIGLFKRPLPSIFVDFYTYLLGLNYSDEVNYFYWRNILCRVIGKDSLANPYEWMMAKQDSDSNSSFCSCSELSEQQMNSQQQIEDQMNAEDAGHLRLLGKLVMKNNKR